MSLHAPCGDTVKRHGCAFGCAIGSSRRPRRADTSFRPRGVCDATRTKNGILAHHRPGTMGITWFLRPHDAEITACIICGAQEHYVVPGSSRSYLRMT